ncbi:MAG: hypothetical protein KAV87_03350 [Desulfobacteraceae bacterium]|nr:hypothetical protein [Desulfobacteraceae bacterium]
MNKYILMLTSLIAGYGMGLVSVTLGACIMSKAMKSGGLFPEMLSPKGDAFTVETPDDMAPFPEDVANEAEEHILKKTNRFLESLDAVPEDKQ